MVGTSIVGVFKFPSNSGFLVNEFKRLFDFIIQSLKREELKSKSDALLRNLLEKYTEFSMIKKIFNEQHRLQ